MTRESIRVPLKTRKKASRAPRKSSPDGDGHTIKENGALARSARGPVFRYPKSELETAIQRFVDLYDFAPIAYVSFDRVGRIQEANLAATQLLDRSRPALIGSPFALHVAKENADLFLKHLFRCRSSEIRVETELRLKRRNGEKIVAHLSSAPTTSSVRDGALLYQTAIVDLTEWKRAEDAVRRSEKRYRDLFDLVPVAVYACNAKGEIQEFNRRAVELWGREPNTNGAKDKFCGSYKIYHPDGRFMPLEKCPMARALRGEELGPDDLEIIVERPDGERRHVIPAPKIVKDDRGQIVGAINCLFDITERKIAEAAALRLAAVVQSSHDAIVAKDLNGIITDWNESAERIFGYKSEEVIGKSILILIPQDRRNEEQEILGRIRRGQSIDHYETVRRRKDGALIDVALTISPIKDLKGKIIGVSKIARDITRQKQAEQRLAEQARLLDLSNDAILVSDAHERIVYWNRGATELYGYRPEEALGKITHELLRTNHPEPRERIREQLERNGRWTGELTHKRKDGSKVVVMSRWVLDRDAQGKPASILETNTDITERKEAELSLQRSRQLLEKLVQQRTKALRAANVELENEIRRRKGLEGEILAISDLEQQRLGQELHDGLCQQLTAISFMAHATALRLQNHRVIDVQDLEKIAQLVSRSVVSARNIARDLHKETVDGATFESALRDLTNREIWKTPCRLALKTETNIENDRVAAELYRILREALVNANKHARATEIVLEVRREHGELVCSVCDNGVGVNSKTKNGRGLGFQIMNYRAQSIGARLEMESRRNRGTCLTVYLQQPQ